jgi:hypothetical protein
VGAAGTKLGGSVLRGRGAIVRGLPIQQVRRPRDP